MKNELPKNKIFSRTEKDFLETIEKEKKKMQNPIGIWEFALIPYHEIKN